MERKIRVLVVDDSAFMRKALTRMLCSDPMIDVVDTASDGEEGVRKALILRPDVVTLDVMMPGMDGLTALRRIMAECPTPVLMLSSLTSEGGETTLKALDWGAADFIDKASANTAMDILTIAGELITKVKALAGVRVANLVRTRPRLTEPANALTVKANPNACAVKVVAIGSSTGGPPALQTILCSLPEDLPAAVLIVQHMPKGFTASLAERLNKLSRLSVKEAEDGDRVAPGRCLIAPSGLHMTVQRNGPGSVVRLSMDPDGLLHRPSVDVLMNSTAKVFGNGVVGVILTGMGADGAKGIKAIHDAGGRTIAQDEETSVVYGMPRVAVELGGVDRSLPLDRVAEGMLEELGVA